MNTDQFVTCDRSDHDHRSLEEARECVRRERDAERRTATTRRAVAKIAGMRRALVVASQLRAMRASVPA